MASSRTQDQTVRSSAAAFDRRPPPELEDTAPFSLLNSLLSDMPDTVRYEPPAFRSETEPPITVTRNGSLEPSILPKVSEEDPTKPVAEKPEPVAEKPKPVAEKPEPVAEKPEPVAEKPEPVAEKPEPVAEKPEPVAEKPEPVAEKPEPVAEKPEPVAEKPEPVAEKPEPIGIGHKPLPLPQSFPKFGEALMPAPPDPPRPKTKRFSALRTPEKQAAGEPKPGTSKTSTDRSSWPRPNFKARPGKRAYDPINKALRIFESLEKAPPEEQPKITPVEPKKKSIFEVFDKGAIDEKPKPSAEEPKKEPTSEVSDKGAIDEKPKPSAEEPKKEPTSKVSDKGAIDEKPKAAPEEPKKKSIFQAFEKAKPIKKSKPPADDLADEETVKVILPKPETASLAEPKSEAKAEQPPEPLAETKPKPEPKTEDTPKTAVTPSDKGVTKAVLVSDEKKVASAEALESLTKPKTAPAVAEVPVPLRRRRRRRVPMNPWTSKSTSPLAAAPDDRKQHIDQTLASLAKILETTLQAQSPSTADTGSVSLKSSFESDPASTNQVKIKLVPRALAERDREATTNLEKKQDQFEMTAPTTLVAKDAPITPFTKIVRATIATDPPPKAPPGPSPFSLSPTALGSTSPVGEKAKTTDKSTKPFASPFSAALQKRAAKPASGNDKTGTVSLRVTRIRPPGEPAEDADTLATGVLPAPTYSFSTMGLPTGKGIPAAAPQPAQATGLTPVIAAPIRSQAPPIAAPIPPTPPDPEPLQEEVEAELKTRKVRKKRRRGPDPEPRSWSFLTGVLAFICVAFLLIYLYEIYHTLKGAPSRRPPIPPDAESIIPEEETVEEAIPMVHLKEPMDCLVQFLAADSPNAKQAFIAEDEEGLAERMTAHYTAFPLAEGAPRVIVDGGSFPDTQREYVIVRLGWEDGNESDAWMIKDGNSDYRFSWYAFEQARNKLLRHYTESAWTGWTKFFVEIKPIDPATLPAGSVLENLYYRVTTPEDPEFEAVGYVDGDSSMVPEFKERFSRARSYNVIAELQRDSPLPDDERPLFRITRLLKASWDPSR